MDEYRKSPVADLFQGFSALILGGFTIYILHDLWFHRWMYLLGDPPASNPAYNQIFPIFLSLPFALGALIIGLVAGFGRVRPWVRIIIRFCAGPLPALLFLLKESSRYTHSYIPLLFASFLISTVISITYERIAGD